MKTSARFTALRPWGTHVTHRSPVTQASKPAVAQVSKPAGRSLCTTPALSTSNGPVLSLSNGALVPAPRPRRNCVGAVLLEVVLALVLFVAAAAVIAGAVNASLEGVQRQKLSTHAVNLAMTVLAELQIGLRSLEGGGPQPFAAPFEHWTWQLVATVPDERGPSQSGLTLVEVVVRHDDPPFVHRLAQRVTLNKTAVESGPKKTVGDVGTRKPDARLASAPMR